MDQDTNVEEWKSGTDALAMCMICGGEYGAELETCPDCNVSLSKVRRCPQCKRVVSFQHTKCVYCRTPFTREPRFGNLPTPAVIPEMPTSTLSATQRRLRAAAVSIGTFVVVFTLGMLFMVQVNKPSFPVNVVARSFALHALELRHSPSQTSSTIDSVAPGAILEVTGYPSGEHGQKWLTVRWKNQTAYVLAKDVAPPKASGVEGAAVLNYYLMSMDNTEVVEDAVKAVDYYVKAFPGDVHGDELRWVLAERLRSLAQHGGSEAASLRRRANQQYELLSSSDSKYADRARDAIAKLPASSSDQETQRHNRAKKTDEIEVVGGSGTQTLTAGTAAHNVLVLNQAEVIVRAGKLSQLKPGTVVTGHVAHAVKANGILAIPAGAACQLRVVDEDARQGNLEVGLTAIDVDHRTYAVKSRLVEVSAREDASQVADRALTFHLSAPLVIER